MSEGYIQRLFDHVAVYRPQVSQIVPAGASTSPVAMADQRLNDPGFADDFSFGSIEIAGMDEDATTVDLFPLPLVTPRPLSREVPPGSAGTHRAAFKTRQSQDRSIRSPISAH